MRSLKFISRSSNLTIISQGEDTYSDVMGLMARFMMESSLPVLAIPSEGINDKNRQQYSHCMGRQRRSSPCRHMMQCRFF